jgi:hypothetical protein
MDLTMEGFFNYGSDPEGETASDVMGVCYQPKRSMFYDRRYGAGVRDAENSPGSFFMQIKTKYDIVIALSLRNQRVPNGLDGGVDRRVAVSQSTISVDRGAMGETDVTVQYVPMSSFAGVRSVSIKTGVPM